MREALKALIQREAAKQLANLGCNHPTAEAVLQDFRKLPKSERAKFFSLLSSGTFGNEYTSLMKMSSDLWRRRISPPPRPLSSFRCRCLRFAVTCRLAG